MGKKESVVVDILGGPVIQRVPSPDTIAKLEELLEMAKVGEIVGICGAVQYSDNSTGMFSPGLHTRSGLGCLVLLQQRLAETLT